MNIAQSDRNRNNFLTICVETAGFAASVLQWVIGRYLI